MFGLPSVPEVDAGEVFESIKSKKDIVLIDVRTEQEYSRGNINGSINIPLPDLGSRINDVVKDKNKNIYLYCLSGSRSAVGVGVMKKLGYGNAFSMTSGLLSWRAKQFPLSTD